MLVTTAISYTNGDPHIGHAFEGILADVFQRWKRAQRAQGTVRFLTGTDEHGQKVQKTAQLTGHLTTKEYCDSCSRVFKNTYDKLSIGYDRFIRTTDQDHAETVHVFVDLCKDDIYLGEYIGWYNTREETFVSEFDAGLANYNDPVSGQPLTKMQEPSYFFKLSKYYDSIKEFLLTTPDFITPPQLQQEILTRLEKPLDDLSISRMSVEWGIPFPNDPSHTVYVWFDALVNYITGACGFNFESDAYHIIGKDILWFHTVIWLAMLMSAGLKLPKRILAHGFVCDAQGRKMSKSLGNVVSPLELLVKYPSDAIRSYFITNFSVTSDFHFAEDALVRHHDSILLADLGNLVQRSLGLLHKFALVKTDAGSVVPSVAAVRLFDIPEVLLELDNVISQFQFGQFAERIWKLVFQLNTYVNETCVWTIPTAESAPPARNENNRQIVLRTLLEGMYIVNHLIAPIIPESSENIFSLLGKPAKAQLSELTWGNFEVDAVVPKRNGVVVFTTLDQDMAQKRKEKNIQKKTGK